MRYIAKAEWTSTPLNKHMILRTKYHKIIKNDNYDSYKHILDIFIYRIA